MRSIHERSRCGHGFRVFGALAALLIAAQPSVAGPLQVLEVVLVPSTMEPYVTQQLKLDFPEGHPRQPRSNSV